jgi:hypothetical protein
MSRYTTLHLKMVEKAARFLTRAPQATVPEAMRVVRFSEDDIADPNIQKQILRRLPGRKKPTVSLVVAAPMSLVACSPMTTLESDITNDEDISSVRLQKRARIRKTASAAMKDRIQVKKKELLLVAVTTSNDEFEVLRWERERRLNEQITDRESSAPTEDELVAALETSVDATTEGTKGSLKRCLGIVLG